MGSQEKVFSFGAFHLMQSRHQLLEGGRPVPVGSRALGLLELLVENAGEVVTKQRPMAAAWNGTWVDETNLRANIGALRKALWDRRDGRRYLVHGRRESARSGLDTEPAVAGRRVSAVARTSSWSRQLRAHRRRSRGIYRDRPEVRCRRACACGKSRSFTGPGRVGAPSGAARLSRS